MGLDCSLFVFPAGRAPRSTSLDRYHHFRDVAGDRRRADMLYSQLVNSVAGPRDREDRDAFERRFYWVATAAIALCRFQRRFGQHVLAQIMDENSADYVGDNHPAVLRLGRMLEQRRERKMIEQAAKDAEDNKVVQRWLAERNRRQYGHPQRSLTFAEFLAEERSK